MVVMEKKLCETCSQDAKIICFCRNALLCERCVGKHLMDEPSLSHKPCTLSSENLKMYEEHIHTLRANEDQLLAEARKRQELNQACRAKLGEGLQRLKALHPVIVDYVSLAAEVVTKQLPEVAERLGHEMIASCNSSANVLQAALHHFEGQSAHPDNPLVQLLESSKTPGEVQALELLTCKLDLGEINIEPLVRAGIHFEIALKKPAQAKTGTVSPQTSKTMIPKPVEKKIQGKPAAKQGGKQEVKMAQGSAKGFHSLNTSVDRPSDDSSDPSSSRLNKKLNELKMEHQKRPKAGSPPPVPSEMPKQTHASQLPLKQATSESHLSHSTLVAEEPEYIKSESPSPEPPQHRAPPTAPLYGLRRFATETPELSLEKSRFTRLQVARTANRKELLKETEKKVNDIEEQIRGLRMMRAGEEQEDVPEEQGTLNVRPEEFTEPPVEQPYKGKAPRGNREIG